MSHHYWQLTGKPEKSRFVCLQNSYHGETLGALAVTDVPLFRTAYGSLLSDVFTVMSPDSRQVQDGESATEVALRAAHELEILLQREHHHIAALILEPLVQCAGQMAMHPPQYLQRARALCDQYGIHLIADEIAVGCGRTGRFFACEHAGIWPDFITLSKGISGGYLPLSLCLTTDTIYQAFYSDNTARGFLHSHSYTGNPLACAAALACLDLFETEHVLDRNLQRAHDLTTAFAWAKTDARIEHLRQQGMILAFDVIHDALNNPGTFAREVFKRGIEKGILVRPIGSTVYVMPPYILSAAETMEMGEGIQRVVEDVLHAQKS
jgi:adenosylmethionine-8-amino-7-oxononanoate aminotransferase